MAIINAGDWPIDPAQTTGNDLADLLNRLTAAIMSSNSGTARPPDITAGMVWTKANTSGTFELMLFTGTADISLIHYQPTTGVITPRGTYTSTQIDNKLQQLESSILAQTIPNVLGGGAITVSTDSAGVKTVAHSNTSSVSNASNSGGTVLQSIGFDTYGHVISRSTVNLDTRYYTQSQSNNRYVSNGSDTMTGSLTVAGRFIANSSGSSSSPRFTLATINGGMYAVTSPNRIRFSVNGKVAADLYEDGSAGGNAALMTRSEGDARWAAKTVSVGAVGSYAFLRNMNANVVDKPGRTRSGSQLAYAAAGGRTNHPGQASTTNPSGTWRCMGFASSYDSDNDNRVTLWQRIS